MRKMLNLSVQADVEDDNTTKWDNLNAWFASLYTQASDRGFPTVNLSSMDLEGTFSDEEYFDEGTLLKVHNAIMEYTASEVETSDLIKKIQDAGIVFREVRK